MNTVIETFANAFDIDRSTGFTALMPKVIEAEPDCGGLLALPFMADEPGLSVSQGGTALIVGWNAENATPGNVVKAALLSTVFNLKLGSEILEKQGYPRNEIILSGGLAKTQECGQIVADVFNTPVSLLESAEEGGAWGSAVMAKFRSEKLAGSDKDWSQFLKSVSVEGHRRFEPKTAAVQVYESVYERYKKLVALQPALNQAVSQ
jgi:sugar (pentulose or hexulose) kinase